MAISLTTMLDYVATSLTHGQDSRTAEEFFNYELEKNKFDINYKKSFLRARKWVGFFTFLLVWMWLFAMLYFILADGMGRLPCRVTKFDLSDTVIVTLITTSTINVVTFLTIVIRNLFPEQKNIG